MTTQSSAPDAVEGARSSATTADGSTAVGSTDSVVDKYGRAHDPMCPWPDCGVDEPCPGYEDCYHHCQCALIAEVRKDERIGDFTGWISPTHHAERMRENYDFGFAAALDRARAAVAAVPWGMSYGTGLHVSQAKAIESIDALRGQPTTCARGCRDGLVRVLSADGEDTEVDLCPCQR